MLDCIHFHGAIHWIHCHWHSLTTLPNCLLKDGHCSLSISCRYLSSFSWFFSLIDLNWIGSLSYPFCCHWHPIFLLLYCCFHCWPLHGPFHQKLSSSDSVSWLVDLFIVINDLFMVVSIGMIIGAIIIYFCNPSQVKENMAGCSVKFEDLHALVASCQFFDSVVDRLCHGNKWWPCAG